MAAMHEERPGGHPPGRSMSDVVAERYWWMFVSFSARAK
jgi:hypothetical protein